jgi:transcriptional regulator with XRE-family HTH domain
MTTDAKKILVRGIPDAHWDALLNLSKASDRSLEAEARQAIKAWVEPVLTRGEQSTRRKDVAKRLQHLLEQSNAGRTSQPRRPSHIAELIGEQSAEAIEQWFLGEVEPSFGQLDRISRALGASVSWLRHGSNCTFPVVYETPPEHPEVVAQWLASWEENGPKGEEQATEIHFVKEASTGRLAIVKLSSRNHPRINIVPSNESSAPIYESSAFHHFSTALQLLSQYYPESAKISISSRFLESAMFGVLVNGNHHPTPILKNGTALLWWEGRE